MASQKDQTVETSRRGFLKMASVSAPAAVAAVAVSGGAAEAATDDQSKSGVKDTAHTKAYYDSARF